LENFFLIYVYPIALVVRIPHLFKLLPMIFCLIGFIFLLLFKKLNVLSVDIVGARDFFFYFSRMFGLSFIMFSCLGFIYYLFSFYGVKGYEIGLVGNFVFLKPKVILLAFNNLIVMGLKYFPLVAGFILIFMVLAFRVF